MTRGALRWLGMAVACHILAGAPALAQTGHKPTERPYSLERPQISREADAEILSWGRPQGPDLDINLTPTPTLRAPFGPSDDKPAIGWMPKPIAVPPKTERRAVAFKT